MRELKGIIIKNVYYMLAYAYDYIDYQIYNSIDAEKFDNIYDLLASILIQGCSYQVKHGLYKEYTNVTNSLSTKKGKINIQNSFKLKQRGILKLNCSYDELSINNIYNQILKSTLIFIKDKVAKNIKKKINQILLHFPKINLIDLDKIEAKKLSFNKLNKNYEILINICLYINKSFLLTTENGKNNIADFFSEETFNLLFEKFILKYYRRHFPHVFCSSPKLYWNFSGENSKYLPTMQTDIVLKNLSSTVIIDAKYYKRILAKNAFQQEKFRAPHIYQIHTYGTVYKEMNPDEDIHLCLIYAKTDEKNIPVFEDCNMQLLITYLDLSQEFSKIKKQLDNIYYKFFD